MAITVEVNGVQHQPKHGTLSYEMSARNPASGRCQFVSDGTGGSAYVPTRGQSIVIKSGGNAIFGGEILTVSESYLIESKGSLVDVTFNDYSIYLDLGDITWEFAAGAYTVQSAITYLCSNHLTADYGITPDGAMALGMTLPALTFKNVTARYVLDTIMKLTAGAGTPWVYRLTPSKLLMAYAAGSSGVSFSLTEGSPGIRLDLKTTIEQNSNYYNAVVLTGTFSATEANTGNGVLTSWALDFDPLFDATGWIISRGVVTEGAADLPLGLYGVDTTTWTYDPGTNTLHRATALGNGVTMSFGYSVGVVTAEDAGEITAHKRRTRRFSTESAISADSAQDLADSYLAIGITGAGKKVSVTTSLGIPYPTQTVSINVASRNISSASYLIETVRVRQEIDGTLLASLTCRAGTQLGDEWQSFYKSGGASSSSSSSTISAVVSVGGSGLAGSGTVGALAKWVTTSSLGNSIASESGSTLTIAGTAAATLFSGSGASLTSLPAGQLTGTITSGVQDNITRTGTLVAGATGSGFTIALTTSTVTGNLPYARMPSGSGTWTANPAISGTLDVSGNFAIATTKFTVVAASGNTVVSGTLSVNASITTPAATNLTLNPTGDLILSPTGLDVLSGANYTVNLGATTNKYLSLHAAELIVESLVAADVRSTVGGRIIVAPTTELTADLAAAGTTITVKHNNLSNGDRIHLESRGQVEFMAVTSGAGGSAGVYTYSVTRNLDGSGANDWIKGDGVVNTRTTGDGFIDLYAASGILSGTGPTIVGNVRTGTTYSNIEARWAIGNLNGLYGYGVTTYGAAFGSPSAAWVKIDPTNGVRIGHNSTTFAQVDASGTASFAAGNAIIDSSGVRVTPSTTSGSPIFTATHAYYWTLASGDMGINGQDHTDGRGIYLGATLGAASARPIYVLSRADNGGQTANCILTCDGTTMVAQLTTASSGVGNSVITIDALAGTAGTGYLDLKATTNVRIGASVTMNSAAYLYPGTASGLSAYQTSYYLASHATWGLYGNTSFGIAENFYAGSGGRAYSWMGDTDTYMQNDTGDSIKFVCGSTDVALARVGTFFPGVNSTNGTDGIQLGNSSFKWDEVWAFNNVIQTSDIERKDEIEASDLGRDFLLLLQPKSWVWKNGTDGRRHYGLVAQDVAVALSSKRLTFGGIRYDENGSPIGLAYTAFIAPIIAGFQDHETRIAALEAARA